ncbi:MAG: glycosyltransferase family 9 protein [bacterium]
MNVLVIKPDHLGDFALALPSLWEVKRLVGVDGRLDVVAGRANCEWSKILGWLPNIFPMDHPRYFRPRRRFAPVEIARAFRLGLVLRKNRYDYAVELTSTVNDWLGKFVFIVAGAKARSGARGAYDFLLHEAHAVDLGHQTEILAQRFPRGWGIFGKADPQEFMPSRLRWSHASRHDVILLSPYAGTSAKEWPLSCWKELMGKLEGHPLRILVPSGRKSDALVLCEGRDELLVYTNSISETLEYLCEARFVVATDSATAHFCWLTGTPLIQIFSGTTEPDRWASLAKGARLDSFPSCHPCHLEVCNQFQHDCMSGIDVESVARCICDNGFLGSSRSA